MRTTTRFSDYDTRQRVITMAGKIMDGATDEELRDPGNFNHNEGLEIAEAHRLAKEYEAANTTAHVRLERCRTQRPGS